MKNHLVEQLTSLAVSLLFSWLIWRNYRRRTFAESRRYSTFGPRFWTGFVDSLVLWPIGFITAALLCLNPPAALAALLVALESLASPIYTVVMHARYGQTVGKMATKIRVLDFRTEGAISWRQAWIREGIPTLLGLGCLTYEVVAILGGHVSTTAIVNGEALVASKPFWLLTAIPGLWFMAEVLTMLTNKKRRALHDFIAGTVVVRTNIEPANPQPNASPNGDPEAPLASPRLAEGPPLVS